jgi:hypothetical protein
MFSEKVTTIHHLFAVWTFVFLVMDRHMSPHISLVCNLLTTNGAFDGCAVPHLGPSRRKSGLVQLKC